MNIKQLAEILSKTPDNFEVLIEDVDGYTSDLEGVSVEDYTKTVILKPY